MGSSGLAVHVVLAQHDARATNGELESFPTHGFDEDAELQLAAAGNLEGVGLGGRGRVTRSATLPSASRRRRSRMTRLCTLSPSWPA